MYTKRKIEKDDLKKKKKKLYEPKQRSSVPSKDRTGEYVKEKEKGYNRKRKGKNPK